MTLQAYNPEQTIAEQYSAALVVGLGATGYSAVRYLQSRGLQVSVLDSRQSPPMLEQLTEHFPDIHYHLGSLSDVAAGELIDVSALLIVSPGVSLNEPLLQRAKQQGAHLVGDIELFTQENDKPLITITGSNGKSTVTTLVGEMCKANQLTPLVAGNIGLPVLDALTDKVDYDVAVLELSSFQLETTTAVPATVSTILNISPDHMDRYDSMGDYVLAKARIFRGAKQVVLPRHDEQLEQITNISNVLTFDLDEPANDNEFGVHRRSNYRWLMKGQQRLMKLRDIPLTGLHNVKNVLCAFALLDFLKLPVDRLVDVVKSFTGLPHRMQTVMVEQGVTWVNDSKATNVGATSTALRNLEQTVIWIAGGQGKGADFTELRDAITSHIKLMIVFGEDADLIESALTGLLTIARVENMQQAVELAGEHAEESSIVLFSPACASFDMYENFEHRGDDFANKVELWVQRGAA